MKIVLKIYMKNVGFVYISVLIYLCSKRAFLEYRMSNTFSYFIDVSFVLCANVLFVVFFQSIVLTHF